MEYTFVIIHENPNLDSLTTEKFHAGELDEIGGYAVELLYRNSAAKSVQAWDEDGHYVTEAHR